MARELTPEEVAELGLEEPAARELTPEEVAALGLDADEPRQDRADAGVTTPKETPAAPESTGAAALRKVRQYGEAAALGGLPLTLAGDLGGFDPANAMRLYGQGMSRGYMDEGVGALESRSLSGPEYEAARDKERALLKGAKKDLGPVGSLLMEAAGGMWGPRSAKRPGLQAAGEGALAGGGYAETMAEVPRMVALGGATGYAADRLGSALGDVAGRALERLRSFAGRRVAAAEQKAADMATKKVAEEVNSARGALGAATQDANRAVENLLRLESTGALTSEQRALLATLRQNGTLPALEAKLADSMLEKVPGAAGKVDISRAAYEGLRDGQNEAAAKVAEELLSPGEAKRQVMERVKRYAPTLAGAYAGPLAGAGSMLAMGGGTSEALFGALAGAGARPALRAVERMAAHPSVQRGMYSPLQRLAGGASSLAGSAGPAAASAARGSALPDYLAEYLNEPDEADALRAALIEALRNRKE